MSNKLKLFLVVSLCLLGLSRVCLAARPALPVNGGGGGTGEANVQSDWNVTNTSSAAYIKNKPTLGGGGTSQTLSLSVNTLTLSDGGGSVDLAKYLDNTVLTEAQVDAYTNNNGYLKSYTETDPLFSAWNKSYNDLINKPTTITAGQASAITALIQSKITAYNKANSVAFDNIDACTKYLSVPTYTHYAFCVAVIAWTVEVWETARQLEIDIYAGVVDKPADVDAFISLMPTFGE